MLGLRILPARLASLFALAALIALAAAALTPPPTTAQEPDGVPERLTLNLELLNDSDGYVQAGSTISIRGQVRLEPAHNDLQISAGNLRLTADQAWEATDRSQLAVNDQLLLKAGSQTQASGAGIVGTGSGNGNELRVIAYDGKTAVARGRNHRLYVFNTETGTQLANLEVRPKSGNNHCALRLDSSNSCASGGGAASEQEWGWGRQSDDQLGNAVAVWQESENRAWLFVGSFRHWIHPGGAQPYNFRKAGALFIFEVNHTNNTVAERRRIYLSSYNEIKSKAILPSNTVLGQDDVAYYGTSVAVSADGGTLAVGAPRVHDVGAVYVYTRPAGGWSAALGWNDGVRVEPVAIPAWGDANTEHPFEPQSTGRTNANNHCDAYCSRVSSYSGDVVGGNNAAARANFGAHLALSGDGGVLAVSAPTKRWASDTPGGSGVFRATNRAAHGEVLIFTAPEGGWSSVPNYKTGRSHIAWNASAASFDPSMHYNSGPNKRVVEPTWSFSFDWASPMNYYLGQKLALSPDGTVLAANDRINDAVNLFQVDSPSGWASGPTAPTAQIIVTDVDDGGRAGEIGFSPDNLVFALGDPEYNSNQGRVLLFERPAAADNSMRVWEDDWADADEDDAEILLAPTAQRVANDRFGRTLAWGSGDPAAPRLGSLAVGASEGDANDGYQSANDSGPGRFWTVSRESPLECPVNARTDADGTTRTKVCAINLGDTSIVIPPGTRDGLLVISGAVTLRYGEDADGQPLTVERTAKIELQIGDVQEVASVQLDFATDDRGTPNDVRDDRPYPSALSARGSSTVLRLQILNEHDKASAAGSVASVIVTTTSGALSTSFGGGCGGSTVTCSINASALSAGNADNIPITLTHPGREGTARISALVLTTGGASYESELREVVLAGTPRALEIAEPSAVLLSVDTPDSGADKDDRDVLTLTVTATDRIGNNVSAPDRNYSYRITGPDGKRVAASKIAVTWPIRGGPNCAIRPGGPPNEFEIGGGVTQERNLPHPVSAGALQPDTLLPSARLASTIPGKFCVWQENRWRAWEAGAGDTDFTVTPGEPLLFVTADELVRELVLADNQPQIRLNVNAAATAALASGDYTLEVRQAGLPWVSRTIRLAGIPAEISFAALDDAPMPNQRFTVTATVSDADGNPVPDGTAVEWSSVQPSGGATLVRLGADLTTTDGEATSTWLAATAGSAWVRAESGTQQQLLPVATAVRQVDTIDQLSRGATPGFGVWLGSEPILASALVARVEGVNGVSMFRSQPSRWLTYAVDDGQLRQGSIDYPIRPGNVYWLE